MGSGFMWYERLRPLLAFVTPDRNDFLSNVISPHRTLLLGDLCSWPQWNELIGATAR